MDTIIIDRKAWTDWLIVKKLSDRTVSEYNYYLSKLEAISLTQNFFLEFLSRNNNSVGRAFLTNLITYIKATYYDDDTQLRILKINLPKVTGRRKRKNIQFLSEAEVIKLANGMNSERDTLMVLITFYGGLRASELVGEYAIKPYDFNWGVWYKNPEQNGTLKLLGKGQKERVVYLPQKVMARLFQYLRNEVSKKQSKDQAIFQISPKRLSVILDVAAKRILDRHINPHLLRHSCSMWLRSKGWDINQRKEYLGHEDVSTTAIYDHLHQEDLKAKFNETIPYN